MARKKADDSPWPYGGLTGLTEQEVNHLKKFLKRKGWSLNYFKITLIREWLRTQTIPAE